MRTAASAARSAVEVEPASEDVDERVGAERGRHRALGGVPREVAALDVGQLVRQHGVEVRPVQPGRDGDDRPTPADGERDSLGRRLDGHDGPVEAEPDARRLEPRLHLGRNRGEAAAHPAEPGRVGRQPHEADDAHDGGEHHEEPDQGFRDRGSGLDGRGRWGRSAHDDLGEVDDLGEPGERGRGDGGDRRGRARRQHTHDRRQPEGQGQRRQHGTPHREPDRRVRPRQPEPGLCDDRQRRPQGDGEPEDGHGLAAEIGQREERGQASEPSSSIWSMRRRISARSASLKSSRWTRAWTSPVAEPPNTFSKMPESTEPRTSSGARAAV